MAQAAASASEMLLIAFRLGREEYGVEVSEVQEIIKAKEMTRVPRSPSYIRGVINLRGNIVPVMDLRVRFGSGVSEVSGDTRIVILNYGKLQFGIIVDAVSEVLRLPSEAVEPPPPLSATVGESFIRGVGKVDGRLIILVDLRGAFGVDGLLEED